jgi:REP element-mobilizing transposase RayT
MTGLGPGTGPGIEIPVCNYKTRLRGLGPVGRGNGRSIDRAGRPVFCHAEVVWFHRAAAHDWTRPNPRRRVSLVKTGISMPGLLAADDESRGMNMPTSCTHLYIHFVWATWNRAPWITAALEAPIYACATQECQEQKCEVLAIGGTEDHVHVLVRLHPTASVADLAHRMKGSSSHLVTHVLAPEEPFKWQGTYGAFSVSPAHLEEVRAYVQRQKEHHASGEVRTDWERCMVVDRG